MEGLRNISCPREHGDATLKHFEPVVAAVSAAMF